MKLLPFLCFAAATAGAALPNPIIHDDFTTNNMSTNRFFGSSAGNGTNETLWNKVTFSESGNPRWVADYFDSRFDLTNVSSGGTLTINSVGLTTASGGFQGDGSLLTNLNASSLASGLVPAARAGELSNHLHVAGNVLSAGDGYFWSGTQFTNGPAPAAGGGGGVTSVGLAAPSSEFSVSGTPVTTSGTLTFAWKVQPITNGETANVDLGNSSWKFGGVSYYTNISTPDGNGQLAIRGNGGPPDRYAWIRGYNGSLGADSGIQVFTTNGAGSAQQTLSIGNSFGVAVVGNLACTGTKPFVIPHPLGPAGDLGSVPATNLLRHAAVEAPRADLIYRGTVTLTNGQARASIDQASRMTLGTFVALTRKPQGWAQNVTGWDTLQIRVDGGDVVIFCQNSGSNDTVSWFVMAERNDPNYLKYCDDAGNFKVEE